MRSLLLLVLISISASAAHSQCLRCDPAVVTLMGTIQPKDFPGPPNYESIRRGDERWRYWIFRLNKPVCVEGDDFDNTRVANVRNVQLVFMDESFYPRYRRYVRQHAQFQVVGSLYHQFSDHHVTKILIMVKSLLPLRK
jgi:Domain of unknown function (DUF4431)